jgi:hypothetical protein
MSLLIIGNTPFYVALLGLAVCDHIWRIINLGCKYLCVGGGAGRRGFWERSIIAANERPIFV